MPTVRMYTSLQCPYCRMAEKLLQERGVQQIEKIEVDQHPETLKTMIEITQRRTVPQIFIGSLHVGGYDDLVALDRQGQLTVLLQQQLATKSTTPD